MIIRGFVVEPADKVGHIEFLKSIENYVGKRKTRFSFGPGEARIHLPDDNGKIKLTAITKPEYLTQNDLILVLAEPWYFKFIDPATGEAVIPKALKGVLESIEECEIISGV